MLAFHEWLIERPARVIGFFLGEGIALLVLFVAVAAGARVYEFLLLRINKPSAVGLAVIAGFYVAIICGKRGRSPRSSS